MAAASKTTRRRAFRLAEQIEKADLEGVVIVPGPNLTYYTGVNAQLLERPFLFVMKRAGGAHLLAPKLEVGPFVESGVDLTIHAWDDTEGPGRALDDLVREIGTEGKWGCEGRVPFGFLDHLLRRGMAFRPADELLRSLREVKEPHELELIRQSARILSSCYLRIPDHLRQGMTELDLSRLIVGDVLSSGAETVEMCMVQSGPRAADPHSASSSRKIRRGESVVVDSVSFYGGYAADITRTFIIGKDQFFDRVYASVLDAQESAVAAAAEGVVVGKVDAAARDSLRRDGLGEHFIHRTGHGLGLEVHEAPYIASGGREKLSAGMVFTVEPGAYIPGKLGVRIEDDLIAKPELSEVITKEVPKESRWWS